MSKSDFFCVFMKENFQIDCQPTFFSLKWLLYLSIFPSSLDKAETTVKNITLESKLLFPKTSSLSKIKERSDAEDLKMIKLIELDILRTHNDVELFEQETSKETLIEILVIYYKQYQFYKQGMNEVLSVVFYACFFDFSRKKEIGIKILDELFQKDNFKIVVFKIFEKIMENYLIELIFDTEKRLLFGNEHLEDESDMDTIIASRINKIAIKAFYFTLYKHDSELFFLLQANGIDPFVISYRCLICLFSREFNLDDTTLIWDSLIYHGFIEKQNKLKIVESFVAAFFLGKKKYLMAEENSKILLEVVMNYKIEDLEGNFLQIFEVFPVFPAVLSDKTKFPGSSVRILPSGC